MSHVRDLGRVLLVVAMVTVCNVAISRTRTYFHILA